MQEVAKPGSWRWLDCRDEGQILVGPVGAHGGRYGGGVRSVDGLAKAAQVRWLSAYRCFVLGTIVQGYA